MKFSRIGVMYTSRYVVLDLNMMSFAKILVKFPVGSIMGIGMCIHMRFLKHQMEISLIEMLERD